MTGAVGGVDIAVVYVAEDVPVPVFRSVGEDVPMFVVSTVCEDVIPVFLVGPVMPGGAVDDPVNTTMPSTGGYVHAEPISARADGPVLKSATVTLV